MESIVNFMPYNYTIGQIVYVTIPILTVLAPEATQYDTPHP